MGLPALPAAAVPALLLLLGAGAARACSADRVRIGPHDYRRVHSIADEAGKHAYILLNYKDLALLSPTGRLDALSPKKVEPIEVTGTIKDMFQMENDTFFITLNPGEKNYSLNYFHGNLKYTYAASIHRLFGIKRCMANNRSDFIFYTDMLDNLYAQVRYRPLHLYSQIDLHRKVSCMAYSRARYFFYTGASVDSLDAGSVEDGPRVEFYTKTPLEVRSMVFDAYYNHYLCHSKGLAMVNTKLPGGLEEFGNFTDCRGLAFYKRHVFMRSGNIISKYHRCPGGLAAVVTPPPATTGMASTTKTIKTKKTTPESAKQLEDPEFIRHSGHTSDYVIPLIVFGYLLTVMCLFGCLGFLVFNFSEERCMSFADCCPCCADSEDD